MTDTRRMEERVAPNVHKHHSHSRPEELKQLFAEVDANKDGRLSLDEVAKLVKELGMSQEDAPSLFKVCSMDSNGAMTWEEFRFLHDKMVSEAKRPDKHGGGHHSYKEHEGEIRRTPAAVEHEMRKYHGVPRGATPVNWDAMHALFRAFDEDTDDQLSKSEVCDLLRVWGTPLEQHLIDKEWPNWDINFDGLMEWDHFKRLYEVLQEKHVIHG